MGFRNTIYIHFKYRLLKHKYFNKFLYLRVHLLYKMQNKKVVNETFYLYKYARQICFLKCFAGVSFSYTYLKEKLNYVLRFVIFYSVINIVIVMFLIKQLYRLCSRKCADYSMYIKLWQFQKKWNCFDLFCIIHNNCQ